MKKIFILFVLTLLCVPVVTMAMQEQKGIHEPGTGITNPDLKEVTQGTGEALDLELVTVTVDNLQDDLDVEQKGIHEAGTGLENPELKTETQGTGEALLKQEQVQKQLKASGDLEAVTIGLEQNNAVQAQKGLNGEAGAGLGEPQLKGESLSQRGTQSERALTRRSETANAVQEMVKVANRNGGVGEQIRTIAQNQNQLQEQAEDALGVAQKRSRFAKFFIGPNYGQLNEAKEKINTNNEKVKELKNLRGQIIAVDQDLLDEQISVVEATLAELKVEVGEQEKGFSLFGWLNRLMSK